MSVLKLYIGHETQNIVGIYSLICVKKYNYTTTHKRFKQQLNNSNTIFLTVHEIDK